MERREVYDGFRREVHDGFWLGRRMSGLTQIFFRFIFGLQESERADTFTDKYGSMLNGKVRPNNSLLTFAVYLAIWGSVLKMTLLPRKRKGVLPLVRTNVNMSSIPTQRTSTCKEHAVARSSSDVNLWVIKYYAGHPWDFDHPIYYLSLMNFQRPYNLHAPCIACPL